MERERRQKYKKQDDEREVIRSAIRDKVGGEEHGRREETMDCYISKSDIRFWYYSQVVGYLLLYS